MPKRNKFEVNAGFGVEVKRLVKSGKSEAMFLHTHVADGDVAGRKFRVSSVIPDGSILIEFEKKPGERNCLGRDRYIVPTRSVVEAIIAHLDGAASEG